MSARRLATVLVVWMMLAMGGPYVGLDPVPAARADAVFVQNATLPSPRAGIAAAAAGDVVYLFGGYDHLGRGETIYGDILRYDPAGDTVVPANASLPAVVRDASAVWTGSHVLLFGGWDWWGPSDRIVRYDPATQEVRTMEATLPLGLASASAVWTGTHAYVFGGYGLNGAYDRIMRYDPAADEVVMVNAKLPSARSGTAAAWDGTAAYVVGGQGSGWNPPLFDSVLRFDPLAGTVSPLGSGLPSPRTQAAAAWADGALLVLGGRGPSFRLDEIVRVNVTSGSALPVLTTLPVGLSEAGAAVAGSSVFLFGGQGGCCEQSSIVRYDPRNPFLPMPPGPHDPVPVIAPIAPAECVNGRAVMTVDGTASFDPDGDAIAFRWSAPGVAFDSSTSARTRASFPLGATTVTLTVSDGVHARKALAVAVVQDTLQPTVAILTPRDGYVYGPLTSTGALNAALDQAVVVGGVNAVATASDQCGVARVEFRTHTSPGVGNGYEARGTTSRSPYTFQVSPPITASGRTDLVATAVDVGGRTATDTRSWTHVGTRVSTAPTTAGLEDPLAPAPGAPLPDFDRGRIGAHLHQRWLSPGSPLGQFELAELANREGLEVVSFGVPVATASARAGAAEATERWLDVLGKVPAVPQLNTFALPKAQQDEAGLKAYFASIAPVLERHGNVLVVVGGNEPLTRGRGWATPEEAAERVRMEYRAWHAVSDLPFCHKFTDPSINVEGSGWSLLQGLWKEHQDAICYNWYASSRDTLPLLDNLAQLGAQQGKAVHILEAAVPRNDPGLLARMAQRVDTLAVYQLVAAVGGEDERLGAWLLHDERLEAGPAGVMLHKVLRPAAVPVEAVDPAALAAAQEPPLLAAPSEPLPALRPRGRPPGRDAPGASTRQGLERSLK